MPTPSNGYVPFKAKVTFKNMATPPTVFEGLDRINAMHFDLTLQLEEGEQRVLFINTSEVLSIEVERA